jgi:4-alpha-glucanotransferase
VLGLGSETRMNTPSQSQGTWTWRSPPGALTHALSSALATLAEVTDRLVPAAGQIKEEHFSA